MLEFSPLHLHVQQKEKIISKSNHHHLHLQPLINIQNQIIIIFIGFSSSSPAMPDSNISGQQNG
ncbi:hypothetical protein Hanom_Chr16g01502231 [Helianthus anomalus]